VTKEEFEKGYAERSNVTIEWLRERHREAVPCDCGDELCQGWQMINTKEFDEQGNPIFEEKL